MVRASLHRVLLAVVLAGSALAFAGVDAPIHLVTALLALALVADLPAPPPVPRAVRASFLALVALLLLQLVPLPGAVRALLQPGFAGLSHGGLAPLSVAPWATAHALAALGVGAAVALTAARIARTRSGLPLLLWLLAGTGLLLALLGLLGEAGGRTRVLLLRVNTGGGSPYGPFVNENHFALAMALTLPAAAALAAVAARVLRDPGQGRHRAVLPGLAALTVLAVGAATLLRAGSRAGALALPLAALATLPLWRHRRARPFTRRMVLPVVVAVLVAAGAASLAWTRLPELREDFAQLLAVEGLAGQTRFDLWRGTLELWQRSPLVGSGAGTFPHAAGLDKPATGTARLEQVHNDWLEWLATTGALGAVILVAGALGTASAMRPARLRSLRFSHRYAGAAAAVALSAAAVHEVVDFGLQIPLNRHLLAAWLGLAWSLARTDHNRETAAALDPEAA